jgi:hypothetical protein
MRKIVKDVPEINGHFYGIRRDAEHFRVIEEAVAFPAGQPVEDCFIKKQGEKCLKARAA